MKGPDRRAALPPRDSGYPLRGAGILAVALIVVGLSLGTARSAGAADFRWRGLLDLVLAEDSDAFLTNQLTNGDNLYDPYRVRLFAESEVSEPLQVLAQLVLDDASKPYVDGAYAIYTPWSERDFHLMAGKIPWAIGTWGPRTYSNKNPLIGAPLIYQHHTTLLWYDVPPDADALLATAGRGARGVNYFGYPEGTGMPLVDDAYWDVGITVAGSSRPFEYALGGVAGTPSWGSTMRDDNTGRSILGRIGFAPRPDLRVGVSGSFGPYLSRKLQPDLPAGHDVNDYNQKLLMADLEILVGHVELRAEGARNFFETPTVGELSTNAGYAELKVLFDSGLYLAGRFDTERFGKITNTAGQQRPWDWNVTRGEGGAGYRISRDATAKLTWQRTEYDSGVPGEARRHEAILAAQLSIAF